MHYKIEQLPVFYRCRTIGRTVFAFDAAFGIECTTCTG